ncbi:putative adhesin [Streptomyces mayteni]
MFHREERASDSTRKSPPSRTAPPPDLMQHLQDRAGNAAVTELIGQMGALSVEQPEMISDRAGSWRAHRTPGRRDGGTVLSGHGAHHVSGGALTMTIPEGTRVHFYTPHGFPLEDSRAHRIERGELGPATSPQRGTTRDIVSAEDEETKEPVDPRARSTHGPGDVIPDYTLYHPKRLNVHGSPIQLRRRRGPYDFRGKYVVGLRRQGPVIISELKQLRVIAPDTTVTVEEAARLSSLLSPGMGDVHFAACRSVK